MLHDFVWFYPRYTSKIVVKPCTKESPTATTTEEWKTMAKKYRLDTLQSNVKGSSPSSGK